MSRSSQYFAITSPRGAGAASNARTGVLSLPLRGEVTTPVFMPVATMGAIRGLDFEKLQAIGYRLILANSYHLYLRPGLDVIEKNNGFHEFTQWRHGMLSDSGGYQVFSLEKFVKITDEGVTFRSHLDGSTHALTPEKVVDIQRTLGSDIIMPLDHCTAVNTTRREANAAVQRTIEWLQRSIDHFKQNNSNRDYLFAITQGNFFPDLRAECIEKMKKLDVDGYAIGGLSVGEERGVFADLISQLGPQLPQDKPRYLMGVGSPDYIVQAVGAGIDMFDSVFPTRVARNGLALTHNGRMNIKNSDFIMDTRPIDPQCKCPTCSRYSRSYIAHLTRCNEIMSSMLLCEHNLYYIWELMTQIHSAIQSADYADYMGMVLDRYGDS